MKLFASMMTDNMPCLSFYAWIVHWRKCLPILSILTQMSAIHSCLWLLPHCMCVCGGVGDRELLFIHLSVDPWVAMSWLLWVLWEQTCQQYAEHISLGVCWTYGGTGPSCLRNLGTIFYNGCSNLRFHQEHGSIPFIQILSSVPKEMSRWLEWDGVQHLYFGSKTQLSIFFCCICRWIQNDFHFYLWKEKPLPKIECLFGITNNTNFKMLK